MTMVNLAGLVPAAYGWGLVGALNPYDNFLLDATAEKFAVVFQVPATGSIETIHFRLGTVTTGDTMKGGLYNIDTNGDPNTASAYGGMTAGTVVVASSDDNITKSVTFAVAATTATAGDICAFVLEFNSFVAGSMNIQSMSESTASGMFKPYVDHFQGAGPSWSKQSIIPLLAVEYSSTTFFPMPGIYPFTAGVATDSFSTNQTIREWALKLNLPAPLTINGLDLIMALSSATASDFEVHVYDSSTNNVVAAQTVLAESFVANNQRASHIPAPIATLAKSTVYRIALKPTSTNTVTAAYGVVPTANALAQVTGNAGSIIYSTRDSGGTWTDTTTRIPLVGMCFTQIDDGAGGSAGMLFVPDMAGT